MKVSRTMTDKNGSSPGVDHPRTGQPSNGFFPSNWGDTRCHVRYFILFWEGDDELHDLDQAQRLPPDGFICQATEGTLEMHEWFADIPRIVVDSAHEKEIIEHNGGKYDGSAPSREHLMRFLLANRQRFGLYPPPAVQTNDAEPRFIATFRPQAWQHDFAVEVGGKVEFDATGKLLSLSLDEIKGFRENNYDSDYLADSLPEREDHDGPFEVDTDLDGWLEANGIKDRSAMTQDDLDRLCEKYGVQVQ